MHFAQGRVFVLKHKKESGDRLKKIDYKSRIFFYFMVLTLLLVGGLGIVNYLNSRKIMIDAVKIHRTDMLIQMKNTNDVLVQNMEQALRGSVSYAELELFATQYTSMENYQMKNHVFKRVSDILKLNTYFTACYVYYPEQDMVIDINSRTPSFLPINQNKNGDMIALIYKAYKQKKDDGQAALYPIIRTGGDTEWFMVAPVQHSSWIMESPLVIVEVEETYFFESLNTIGSLEDAKFYIKTPQNVWIGEQRPDNKLLKSVEKKERSKSEGDFIYIDSVGKQFVLYAKSAQLGWEYFCVIPLKAIYAHVEFLATMGLVTAIFCIIVGIVLAKRLSGRLYLPIERLSGQIKRKTAKEIDAFQALSEGVGELLSKNAQMQVKLMEQEQIAKNAFLFRLLQDDIELYDSLYEHLESYRIPFQDNMRYLVALITLEHDEALRPTYEERQMQWEKVLSFDQTLKKAFSTLKDFHIETVHVDENTLAILLGIENHRFTYQEMKALLNDLQQDAEVRLDSPVTLGFSQFSEDIATLPELNRQANEAVEHHFFLGGSRAIGFNELPKEVIEAYRYPWDLEKIIISGLRKGEEVQVYKAIDEFEGYISSKIHKVKQSRMAFLHLCNDIVRLGEEIIQEEGEETLSHNLYQSVLICESSADIVMELKRYSTRICNEIKMKREERNNDIAQAARGFLEENYNNSQLSLDVLSQELGFSISYISKMFKASMGVSVKEYLIQKRIEVACDLLLKSDKKIWEIGDAVGYDQQRSFLEIFKKHKGMTPSDYRKQQGGFFL